MKKKILVLTLVLCVVLSLSLAACAGGGGKNPPVTPPNESDVNIANDFTVTGKILVVYFSKTGTTESVANKIRELTGADIFEIERKEPYPEAYTPTTEVAEAEKDRNARPELAAYLPKDVVAEYDTIFVGFPIWWHTAPMPVLSFLNFYNWSGKTVYTFCTAASSGISESTADIRSNAQGATVIEGRKFSRNDSAIDSWVNSLDLPDNQPITPETPSAQDILVVYFSASGNTRKVAGDISDLADAALFELVPVRPYTDADLNYRNPDSRVSLEHEDERLRDIALVSSVAENWDRYEIVFVGYPIWWQIAAWPVNDFIASNDFTGKTVIPFATSSSSGIGQSGRLLAETAGTGNWQEGRRFRSGASRSDVEIWLSELGYLA